MAIVHLGNQQYTCLSSDTKPTTAPANADLWETDTGRLFWYNGASWIRSERNQIHDYDYIIYRSGSNTKYLDIATDLTVTNSNPRVIIQTVYDLVAANSDKNKVYQLNGTYDIDTTLTAPSYLVHEGQSWNTLIRGLATITSSGVIRNSDQASGNVQMSLRRFKVDQHLAGTGSAGACVHFVKVQQSTVENCYIHSKQFYGLWWSGNNTNIYDNRIMYNTLTGTGANDPLGGGSLTHSWVIGNTFFNGTAGGGGLCTQRKPERTIFAFNHCYGSSTSGMSLESAIRCIVYGNSCYDNDHVGIKSLWTDNTGGAGGSPTELIVANNYCYSNTRGIQLEGGGHLVTGNYCSNNQLSGIEIVDNAGESAAVINDFIAFNTCLNNGLDTGGSPTNRRSGIRVVGSGHVINNNYCTDNQGVKTQVSGIDEVGTADSNIIKYNYLVGNLTRAMSKVGASTKVKFNEGYITENQGSNTKNGGSTSVTIAHGLSSTPTFVQVEPKSDDAMGNFKRSADATNITLTYPFATPSGTNNLDYYWRAEV